MNKRYIILAVLLIIIIVLAGGYLGGFFNEPLETTEQPNLQVSLQTVYGRTGESSNIYLEVSNTGGDAKDVIVNIASQAFSQGTTGKFDVPAGKKGQVACQVNINDIASKDYPVAITYTYEGSNTREVSDSPNFYVVPKLEIVNQHWLWPAWALQEKSTITPNDETTLFFKVKSDSNYSCKDLSLTIAPQEGTTGLTLTPTTLQLDPIGPVGTSTEYSINFKSTNMPPGTYTINLKAYVNGFEAGTLQVTLWVKAA